MQNDIEIDLKYKDKKEIGKSGILGFFIGLAVIVPGISGSTIAILFKLYNKLLLALSNILKNFKLCFLFLLPILLGLLIGIGLGFITVKQLLSLLPFTITSLFAGLMFGALPIVQNEIKKERWSYSNVVLFVVGISIPILISTYSIYSPSISQNLLNLNFYHYLLFILIGYIVAITQIVPGLSATAILMSFGYFRPLIDSINIAFWKEQPSIFLVYGCLGIGLIIGLLSFSKLLSKLLNKNRIKAFFVILGLSLGSIVSMFYNPDIYSTYQSWQLGNKKIVLDLPLGIVFFIVGTIIAYTFVSFEKKKLKK